MNVCFRIDSLSILRTVNVPNTISPKINIVFVYVKTYLGLDIDPKDFFITCKPLSKSSFPKPEFIVPEGYIVNEYDIISFTPVPSR